MEPERGPRFVRQPKPNLIGTVSTPTEMDFGTADTANTDDWNRGEDQATNKGVKLTLTVRVIYSTTNQILRRYTRVLTFDSKGCLREISAETQGTIDTPGAC